MPETSDTDLTRKPPVFLGRQFNGYIAVVTASVTVGLQAVDGRGLAVFLTALASGVCALLALRLVAALVGRPKGAAQNGDQ